MALNDKQRQFVREYTVDFNGKQAAIRAGYSAKTAEQTASRLLRNVKVQAELTEAIAARSERTEVTADYVLGKLVENVERSMQAQAVMDEDGEPIGNYQYQGSVANKALELLGKHLKLFTEKVEHAGAGGGPIRMIEVVETGAGDDSAEDEGDEGTA